FTAPVTVPFAVRLAVALAASTLCPSNDEACSAWLGESALDRVLNDVFSCVIPCAMLSWAEYVRKVLLSPGLVGSWFFNWANMSVRKFVPPKVVALFAAPAIDEEFDPIPAAELV